jgi:hypothetical protein
VAVTFRARREVESKRMGVLGGIRLELLKWDSEASIVIGLPIHRNSSSHSAAKALHFYSTNFGCGLPRHSFLRSSTRWMAKRKKNPNTEEPTGREKKKLKMAVARTIEVQSVAERDNTRSHTTTTDGEFNLFFAPKTNNLTCLQCLQGLKDFPSMIDVERFTEVFDLLLRLILGVNSELGQSLRDRCYAQGHEECKVSPFRSFRNPF